jgi:hypothetical protein
MSLITTANGNTAALVDTLWVSSGKDADLDNNIVINQNTVAIAKVSGCSLFFATI